METEDQQSIKARMKVIDDALDAYEKSIGVPVINSAIDEDNITKCISMPQSYREKMTIEECAEMAVECNILAYHMMRAFNREKARHTWAHEAIQSIVSSTCHQFSGTWQRQEKQAIAQDSAAAKLEKIKNYAQQRMDRINYLPNQLKNLADSFNNLQRAKATKNG